MTVRCFSILLLLSTAAIGCGDDDDQIEIEPPPAPTAGSSAGGDGDGNDGDADGDGNRERVVNIVATEFQFTPDRIDADPGETIIVSLRNAGTVEHSIEFELADGEVELDENVAPGDTAQLTLEIPDETGDFAFFCPIDDHRQLGMEGTLVVGE